MPTAIAFRHVAFEDLGTIAPLLAARGWTIAYRDAVTDPLDGADIASADLLVVLGGPIGAYEAAAYPFLDAELRAIERRLQAGRAVLGICLGAQLMARALGARVYPGRAKEIGWSPLTLSDTGRRSPLAAFDGGAAVLHWHGDTFDLPAGATHLAASALYENQAFAWGHHGLALQCHIEVEAKGLERWYVGHAAELAAAGISVTELRAESRRQAPALARPAARCFLAWLEDAGRQF